MIRIEGIRKTFLTPNGERFEALRGIDLNLGDGEFLVVIGTNGSGKSTLLNAIAGTFRPDEGRIWVDGRDVTREPEYRRARSIGRVFQDPYRGTAPGLTVAENLRLASLRGGRRTLRIGLNRGERQEYQTRLARYGLGLEDRLDAMAGTLSGGQRQALTLLMATLRRPAILLLDEHTAALDPRAAEAVIEMTRRIVAEERITTLMVTHSMAQATEVGTATILVHGGQIARRFEGELRSDLSPEDLRKLFDDLYRIEAVQRPDGTSLQ